MSAIDELRRLLDERGVAHSDHYFSTTWRDEHGILHLAGEPMADGSLVVDMLTPEQAIAATLGSDASAVRLAERFRSIADEMRSVGASSMTPHELLVCYANDVDKVADSLMFAATLGSETCEDVGRYCFTCSKCGWTANEPHHAFGGFWPKFCPNCGCKVVGE